MFVYAGLVGGQSAHQRDDTRKKNKEGMKVTREKKERKKGEQQEKRKERGREIMKGMRDTWRPLSFL